MAGIGGQLAPEWWSTSAGIYRHAAKNILSGYDLDLSISPKPIHILDPFSVFVLKRAIFENYLTINYLTLSTDSKEADLRFKIWMMFGLSKRNCSDLTSDEALRVQSLDSESIKSLERQIKESDLFRLLDSEKQITLFKTIKRDWKIIFNKERFTVASWQILLDYTGIKTELKGDIYNFLSWHAHSQSISTLQLADMYDDSGMDLINIKISTKELSIFIAFLINDLIILDKSFEKTYQNLSDYQREIITFYNNAFRFSEYIYEKIES